MYKHRHGAIGFEYFTFKSIRVLFFFLKYDIINGTACGSRSAIQSNSFHSFMNQTIKTLKNITRYEEPKREYFHWITMLVHENNGTECQTFRL